VTCTFVNTKRGHIIVDKQTNPAADPQVFSFDAGGAGYGDFTLTDAQAPNNQEVVPGAYSVSETVPAGWDQTSATCDKGETPASLDVEPGETVTCTFVNTSAARSSSRSRPGERGEAAHIHRRRVGSIGDGGTITVSTSCPASTRPPRPTPRRTST
jgi:hypothetical protein